MQLMYKSTLYAYSRWIAPDIFQRNRLALFHYMSISSDNILKNLSMNVSQNSPKSTVQDEKGLKYDDYATVFLSMIYLLCSLSRKYVIPSFFRDVKKIIDRNFGVD